MKCRGCFERFDDKLSECPKCGMVVAKAKPLVAPEDAPRIAAVKKCIAYGCRLSGTWNPMIYGDTENWQCFIHSGIPVGDWQKATAVINRMFNELNTIPNEYAFRAAMRDAVAGRSVSKTYWTHDGVTRNFYLDEIRRVTSARKTDV